MDTMSVHTAKALIGWRTSSPCMSTEGGEAYECPRFFIEIIVARGGGKLTVLRVHHDATTDSSCPHTFGHVVYMESIQTPFPHSVTLQHYSNKNIFPHQSVVIVNKNLFLKT
jgi:hypothetical protein